MLPYRCDGLGDPRGPFARVEPPLAWQALSVIHSSLSGIAAGCGDSSSTAREMERAVVPPRTSRPSCNHGRDPWSRYDCWIDAIDPAMPSSREDGCMRWAREAAPVGGGGQWQQRRRWRVAAALLAWRGESTTPRLLTPTVWSLGGGDEPRRSPVTYRTAFRRLLAMARSGHDGTALEKRNGGRGPERGSAGDAMGRCTKRAASRPGGGAGGGGVESRRAGGSGGGTC